MGDSKVKLQIWDTAGQERFRTITTAYYRGAMGILLVYDVSDETSFSNVRNWMRQIGMDSKRLKSSLAHLLLPNSQSPPSAADQNATENVSRILVGNKCDVSDSERKVSPEQGKKLAAEFGIKFFETSAKTNQGVDEAFSSMAKDIVERLKVNPEHYGGEGGVNIRKDSKKASPEKGGCC